MLNNPDQVLPGDVRALLVARLDQLTREVRDLVQRAAVLGREFELRMLVKLVGAGEGIDSRVQRAERQAIWYALDELRYLFRHALLRDTAYRMQVRARRQELHALVVESFERLHKDDLSDVYHELAYHGERSGNITTGLKYLEAAADKAAGDFQNEQARGLYGRALALAPNSDLELRFKLLLAHEDMSHRLGDRESQRRILEQLEQLNDGSMGLKQQADLLFRRAILSDETGDFEGQIQYARVVLELAGAESDPDISATAQMQWGTALYWQGHNIEALEHHLVALEQFTQSGNLRGEGEALFYIAEAEMRLLNAQSAVEQLNRALELDRRIANPQREASTLNMLGIVFEQLFDYGKAREYLERAFQIYTMIGNRRGQSTSLNNLVLQQKDFDT